MWLLLLLSAFTIGVVDGQWSDIESELVLQLLDAPQPSVGHRVSPSQLLHRVLSEVDRRRLYDVEELTDRADASILDECQCPFAASECPTATIYNNTMLYMPDDVNQAMFSLHKDPMPLDVSTAGNDACQEIDGFELCQANSTCVPDPEYIVYDCEKLTETLLGVAASRAEEISNFTDEEIYDLIVSRTGGDVTGTDDVFGTLSPQSILIYVLLEQTGFYSCTDGCNLYDVCADLCAETAREDLRGIAETNLAASEDCQGIVDFLSPTSLPTSTPTSPPAPVPTTSGPATLPTADIPVPTALPALQPTAAPVAPSRNSKSNRRGLNSGEIAGIVVAALVLLLCCCFILVYFLRQRSEEEAAEGDKIRATDDDESQISGIQDNATSAYESDSIVLLSPDPPDPVAVKKIVEAEL